MDAENRSDQPKNFGQWLDSALRTRIDAEPRLGLEERVLARLALDPQRMRASWWPLFAFATAALVIGMGLALMRTSKTDTNLLTRQNSRHRASEMIQQPSIRAMAAPSHEIGTPLHVGSSGRKRAGCCHVVSEEPSQIHSELLPKLAAFPVPRPETEQERLLLGLAARPDLLQTAHLSSNLPLRELSIPPLNIPPMEGTPPDNPLLY